MRGFSLLEALIAFSIATTTIITFALIVLGMPEVLASSKIHREARAITEEEFDRTLARSPRNFSALIPATSTADIYKTVLNTLSIGDESAKELTYITSWKDGVQPFVLTGVVTDHHNASDYICSPFAFGSWTSPTQRELGNTSLPPISSLAASRTLIVAVSSSTPNTTDGILYLLSARTGEIISSFDTTASSTVGYEGVAISGTTMYAFTPQTTCKVSEPLCARLDILSYENDGILLKNSIPSVPISRVMHRGARLYVGYEKHGGPELRIFDVTEPTNPVAIGDAEINSKVNDILVTKDKVFVATAENRALDSKAVMVFDASNTEPDMQPLDQAWHGGAGFSRRLTLSGNTLLVGRSYLANSKELLAVNANRLSSVHTSADTDTNILDLVVYGFRVFVLTKNSLQEWDTGLSLQRTQPFPFGTSGSSLVCSGTKLFLAANSGTQGHVYMLSGT